MPPALDEFSSHQLLWNHVAAELASDPFAIGEGPGPYLERSMKRHGVSAEGFDAGIRLGHSLDRQRLSPSPARRTLPGHGARAFGEPRPERVVGDERLAPVRFGQTRDGIGDLVEGLGPGPFEEHQP